MSTRGTGPPGNGAGAGGDTGARRVETRQRAAARRFDASDAIRPFDEASEARSATVEAYLTALVVRCDDVPLLAELDAADIGTPRGTASIARAALAWLRDGAPDVIRDRLLGQLEEADRLTAHRFRQLSLDLSQATDWKAAAVAWKPADEWARLRIYEAPPPRQVQPWMAAELDVSNWRETAPPREWWMFATKAAARKTVA